MPFRSQAQRGYMFANHPKMAKEFEAVTPNDAKLPYHVPKKMAEGGEVKESSVIKKLRDIFKNKDVPMMMDTDNAEAANKVDESSDTVKGMSEGGEVNNKQSDNGTLKGLAEVLRKLKAGEPLPPSNPPKLNPVDFSVPASTKNYAGGGDSSMKPLDPTINSNPTITSLSDMTSALNKTPDTNYDFYKDIGSKDRANLYKRLSDQQKGAGALIPQALGGIGDAISNSFGGQHNTYLKDVQGIQEKRKEGALGAFDTQRIQKQQDMQANQDAQLNDPDSPMSSSLRDSAKAVGMNVGSRMPGNIVIKLMGPMGDFALKKATIEMTGEHNKATEANAQAERVLQGEQLAASTANQQAGRQQEAAKGLQARPWYQKGLELVPGLKSDATKTMQSELTGNSPSIITATNSVGHKITSKDGGQTWQ